MRVEKQGAKGEGGHGFHHFFDRKSKSSKKLVSKVPDLSVQLKQKTSIDTNTQITQYHPVIEDYTASSLIIEGCTSSLNDEDDNGKSPGVVARLMGLDFFPTSTLTDTQSKSNSKSTRFFDTRSMQDSSALHARKILELEQKDYRQVEQKHKIIEKFQTESLRPKSARSAPITQHKNLSPIKSSSVVSSNDPTRIMEAVSKIPLKGSTSVDFSTRNPSPTRSMESNAARKLKGQSMNKSWDGCLEQKDGKKSVSLAIQAKVNVKKREGLTLNEAKFTNNQAVGEKNTLKKPVANRVLKQNNKKQNCIPDRNKSTAKSSVSSMNTQSRKPANKIVDRRKRFTEDVKNKGSAKNDKNGKIAAKSNGLDVISFTFTSPISRSMDKNNRNSLSSATGGGSLSTLLDQQLRALTAMSQDAVFQESRITRTIIFQDTRNRDRTSRDGQVACQEFDAVFSSKLKTTEVDTESSGTKSERVYIKNILSNIESMFENFTLNRTSKIVNPRLFDQLEAQKLVFDKKRDSKLRRKLVFDCVSECVDTKCAVWLRGLVAVRRKDRLVEHVCNKINEWEHMKDCMVDELVDKDMSCGQHKKWLDFDYEAFEMGVEIEGQLLGFLIDEAIVDMLVS